MCTTSHLKMMPLLVFKSLVFRSLWKNLTPSKVVTFSWQLILDRISSREIFFRKRVSNDIDATTCVLCGDLQKSSLHFFVTVIFFFTKWVGWSWVIPRDLSQMLLQAAIGIDLTCCYFGHLGGMEQLYFYSHTSRLCSSTGEDQSFALGDGFWQEVELPPASTKQRCFFLYISK